MTKAEFLQDLATKVFIDPKFFAGWPEPFGATGYHRGRMAEYKIPSQQLGLKDTTQSINLHIIVRNEGITTGPQVWQWDVPQLDASNQPVMDGDNVLYVHRAGDPVLDENDAQIVVPEDTNPFLLETASMPKPIEVPILDALAAADYIRNRVGTDWNGFDIIKMNAAYGYVIFSAFVEDVSGEEVSKVFRLFRDAEGSETHRELPNYQL